MSEIRECYMRVNKSRLECPVIHLHGHFKPALLDLPLTPADGILNRVCSAIKLN